MWPYMLGKTEANAVVIVVFAAKNAIDRALTTGSDCMKMSESLENYLETILILTNRKGVIHSIDIANKLSFSKPSVSRAVHLLEDNGYITIDSEGVIILTDMGNKKAADIYERHVVLSEFLENKLGVDPKNATQDACRMEHVISEKSFENLKAYMTNSK